MKNNVVESPIVLLLKIIKMHGMVLHIERKLIFQENLFTFLQREKV